MGHLEEALIPLTSAERTVGRLAETLPADAPVLPGAVAFRLHDTYGFPIDLTVELAAEYGVRTDLAGFQDALAEQRERSRANTKTGLAEANLAASRYAEILARTGPTMFLGYETTAAVGRVVAILRDGTEYETLEGGRRGRAAGRGRRARGAGARPDPVLRGVRRPGGRHRDPRPGARRAAGRLAGPRIRSAVHGRRRPAGRRHADRGPHGPPWRPAGERPRGRRAALPRGRRAPRPHHAQPHRHAPAPPRAAQRGGGAGPPGRARWCTRTTCASTSRSTAA